MTKSDRGSIAHPELLDLFDLSPRARAELEHCFRIAHSDHGVRGLSVHSLAETLKTHAPSASAREPFEQVRRQLTWPSAFTFISIEEVVLWHLAAGAAFTPAGEPLEEGCREVVRLGVQRFFQQPMARAMLSASDGDVVRFLEESGNKNFFTNFGTRSLHALDDGRYEILHTDCYSAQSRYTDQGFICGLLEHFGHRPEAELVVNTPRSFALRIDPGQ